MESVGPHVCAQATACIGPAQASRGAVHRDYRTRVGVRHRVALGLDDQAPAPGQGSGEVLPAGPQAPQHGLHFANAVQRLRHAVLG